MDTLVGVLVDSAARRWPPALRDEQRDEWTAELEALREEPRSGPRRFTFALSLATSPAPDDGSGLRGWRELLPGLGTLLRPAAGFAVLSVLILQMWPLRLSPSSGAWALPVGVLLGMAVVPLCYLAGRRSTASTAHPIRIAGVVTTGAALGYLVYWTVPLLVSAWALSGPADAFPVVYRLRPGAPPTVGGVLSGLVMPQGHVMAALLFVALTAPLLAGVLFLTVQRGWRLGVPLACAGLPVIAVLSWAVGLAAAPESAYEGRFFDPIASIMDTQLDGGLVGVRQISAMESLAGVLLLLGATVTAYGLGLATRARVPGATASAPSGSAPEWTLARAAAMTGGGAVVVGLAAWVYVASILPPLASRDAAVAAMVAESADELRWGAVILTMLGARIVAARRRGATLAALLLGGWLLAAEGVLTRPSLIDGPLPAATAAAIATVGIGLVWWVSGPRGDLAGEDATTVRRAHAVAAVVAAACGPLLLAQVDVPPDAAGAAVLRLVLVVVPAAFVVLAVFAAAAARDRSIPLAATVVLALAFVAASVAVGAATAAGEKAVGVAAGLFAVGAAAVALARPGHAAHWCGWAVAAVLAPVVLAPATFYAAIVPSILLRAINGADAYPVAAMSFQPGVLLAVFPAAAVLARWLIRDTPTADPFVQPAPASGPTPTVAPVGG
ncbi:hypothetical protein ACTMTJ_42725 [Phytohabitans sp. LJ34]|uniref:hypothetical protein n=1 Tax=Phytohabitans sp. LJ34 TaxID=3452217 RepID=UPI003F8C097C